MIRVISAIEKTNNNFLKYYFVHMLTREPFDCTPYRRKATDKLNIFLEKLQELLTMLSLCRSAVAECGVPEPPL
jgi:hypothetical protein